MITGYVTGDTSTLLYLKSRGIVLRDELRRVVNREGIRVLALVKEKVSGPVLKNRTGTLRRKLNVQFAESPTELTASVGLKLKYAAVHEYGITKTVTVREHLRHVKSGDVRGRFDGKRRLLAKGIGVVRAHEMHMHMPERSYLRSTLREQGPTIREQLKLAVRRSFA